MSTVVQIIVYLQPDKTTVVWIIVFAEPEKTTVVQVSVFVLKLITALIVSGGLQEDNTKATDVSTEEQSKTVVVSSSVCSRTRLHLSRSQGFQSQIYLQLSRSWCLQSWLSLQLSGSQRWYIRPNKTTGVQIIVFVEPAMPKVVHIVVFVEPDKTTVFQIIVFVEPGRSKVVQVLVFCKAGYVYSCLGHSVCRFG